MKYYVSINYERNIPEIVKTEPTSLIGLDFGLKNFYVDSNGNKIEYPKFFKKSLDKLAFEQRKLSKMIQPDYKNKYDGSNNYIKQRIKVARIYELIRNQRKDFLHKQSCLIAKDNDIVGVESLDLIEMRNGGYAKEVTDTGWGTFLIFLKYKLEKLGKILIKVDKHYPSSQICALCGSRHEMPLTEKTYICRQCNLELDRDFNAALNIANEALRLVYGI